MTGFKKGDTVMSVSDSTIDIRVGGAYRVYRDSTGYSINIIDDAGDRRCRSAHMYTLVDDKVKENKMATIKKNFKVGDVVEGNTAGAYKDFYKILAVTDYGYVTTRGVDDFDDIDETDVDETLLLIENQDDYVTTDGTVEYTLEEVADELGIDVKRLRIKD